VYIDRPASTLPASHLPPPPAAWLASPPMLSPETAKAQVDAATTFYTQLGQPPPPNDVVFPPTALPADLADLAAALNALPPPPPVIATPAAAVLKLNATNASQTLAAKPLPGALAAVPVPATALPKGSVPSLFSAAAVPATAALLPAAASPVTVPAGPASAVEAPAAGAVAGSAGGTASAGAPALPPPAAGAAAAPALQGATPAQTAPAPLPGAAAVPLPPASGRRRLSAAPGVSALMHHAHGTVGSAGAVRRRSLLVVEDQLDAFR
jgi:hypothetical protein